MTSAEAVAAMLAMFKAAYPTIQIAQETVDVWCEALGDLEPEAILAAGRQLLQSSKVPALPGIGAVRERAEIIMGRRFPPGTALYEARRRLRARPCDGDYVYSIAIDGLDPWNAQALREASRKFGLHNIAESDLSRQDVERFERLYISALEAATTMVPALGSSRDEDKKSMLTNGIS